MLGSEKDRNGSHHVGNCLILTFWARQVQFDCQMQKEWIRRVACFTAIFTCLCLRTACFASNVSDNQSQCTQLVQNLDIERAQSMLRNDKDGSNRELRDALEMLYRAYRGDITLEDVNNSLAKHPRNHILAALSAIEFHLRNKDSEGVVRAKEAVSLAPESAIAQVALAICEYGARGKQDGVQKVLQQFPNDFDVLSVMARHYNSMREQRKARDLADKLVQHHPDKAGAFATRASLFSKEASMGRVNDLSKSLQLTRDTESKCFLLRRRAKEYNALGQPRLAYDDMTAMIAIAPPLAGDVQERAQYLAEAGAISQAVQVFAMELDMLVPGSSSGVLDRRKILSLRTRDLGQFRTAFLARTELLVAAGEKAHADAERTRYLKAFPGDAAMLYALNKAIVSDKGLRRAIADLDKLIAHEEAPRLYRLRAKLYARLGNVKQAQRDRETARSLDLKKVSTSGLGNNSR